MRIFTTFSITILIVISAFFGCKSQPSSKPAKTEKTQAQAVSPSQPQTEQVQLPQQEKATEEGYVYQPRDRRDPFVPLIVTTQKLQKKAAGKIGTLESYDITEFELLAIAEKGGNFFALLSTPDNRSFTVRKGTVIGLHKGRIQEITSNKVLIVEYSKDYRGDVHPIQITLEFLKER